MYDVFLTIAEITLAMTPLLLLALLFSRFGRRFSAGCRYTIWCILLLRLAIPLNFSLPVPAITLEPPTPLPAVVDQIVSPAQTPAIPIDVVSIDANDPSVSDGIPDSGYVTVIDTLPSVKTIDPTKLLALLWAVGAAGVLLYHILTCCSAAAHVRRWKLPATDARLLNALEGAQTAVGLRRHVTLWLCPAVSSPMLRGLFSPEILLPHANYTDDQLNAILRHELIHCRRGDLWWKLIGMIATSVHFFNPLVWYARKQQELEMEQSCDEAVFRIGDVSRHTYGEAMLAVAREGLDTRAIGLNTHFHASAKNLKARFANILDSTAKRAGVWLIVLALGIALLCCGLVSCGEEVPPADLGGAGTDTSNDTVTDPTSTESPDPATTIADTSTSLRAPSDLPISLVSPLAGSVQITQGFGYFTSESGKQEFHNGIDYTLESTTTIFAAEAGTVTRVDENDNLGLYVIVDHGNGIKTLYGHLQYTILSEGMEVTRSGVIGSVGGVGAETGNLFHFALYIDVTAVDPQSYLHWGLQPVFTYTLDYSLPRLHTWTQLDDPEISAQTVSRLGSEYTAIDYMLRNLYDEDHKYGQFTLTTEQLIIDGKTMDSVWEIHQSSYSSIYFAMTAGGGAIFHSEDKVNWRAVKNGNIGTTLSSETYTATAVKAPSPLFAQRVWMVKNEEYEVKLTGVATVKINASPNSTVPQVFAYTIAEDIPQMLSGERIADAYFPDEVKARITAEYKRAIDYIERKYGTEHDYISLHLLSTAYTQYESVWNVKKADGTGFCIVMTPGGENIYIGSLWSETLDPDTFWVSPPRYSEDEPNGTVILTRGTAQPVFPCDVIFNLN